MPEVSPMRRGRPPSGASLTAPLVSPPNDQPLSADVQEDAVFHDTDDFNTRFPPMSDLGRSKATQQPPTKFPLPHESKNAYLQDAVHKLTLEYDANPGLLSPEEVEHLVQPSAVRARGGKYTLAQEFKLPEKRSNFFSKPKDIKRPSSAQDSKSEHTELSGSNNRPGRGLFRFPSSSKLSNDAKLPASSRPATRPTSRPVSVHIENHTDFLRQLGNGSQELIPKSHTGQSTHSLSTTSSNPYIDSNMDFLRNIDDQNLKRNASTGSNIKGHRSNQSELRNSNDTFVSRVNDAFKRLDTSYREKPAKTTTSFDEKSDENVTASIHRRTPSANKASVIQQATARLLYNSKNPVPKTAQGYGRYTASPEQSPQEQPPQQQLPQAPSKPAPLPQSKPRLEVPVKNPPAFSEDGLPLGLQGLRLSRNTMRQRTSISSGSPGPA